MERTVRFQAGRLVRDPFKRNPINCEKIDSLCRYVASMESVVWQNSANTLLERTLTTVRTDGPCFRGVPGCRRNTGDGRKDRYGMQVHDTGVRRNLDASGCSREGTIVMELGRREPTGRKCTK
jgi:adenylosuccinate lyase